MILTLAPQGDRAGYFRNWVSCYRYGYKRSSATQAHYTEASAIACGKRQGKRIIPQNRQQVIRFLPKPKYAQKV